MSWRCDTGKPEALPSGLHVEWVTCPGRRSGWPGPPTRLEETEQGMGFSVVSQASLP